ncbi:MAG: diadenylate cyclase [Desulfocapsaceae bacterium]|nr:diadenylate cyclase [Desulfocapsaceae bacterium]
MESLWHFFVSLRWQDVLDIAINSYLLFRLYILFRGTNIIRMLVVIGILWLLKRISADMGMIVTSWVVQGIIAATALIIIIVFRNEISTVFQMRSLRSFFWGIPQRQVQTPIDIIADSVGELAKRKLGALIVLPLKKGLDDIIHGGLLWQGKLSTEMLVSIFLHDSPVHDGAIVIQGNQVVKVGAILPLSKDTDLPSHFGTRHRAAAGLSEQTDALIVVVSEERGGITVFKDQSIINIDKTMDLSDVLLRYTGSISPTREAKSQRVELGAVAATCLLVVAGIWFSFARGMDTFTTLQVPIEFVNRGQNIEIFNASVGSVQLQVSGSRSLINSVNPDQIQVKLDLANVVPGKNIVPISSKRISLPPGIDLKQIEPQSVTVNVDFLKRKKLSVQPNWIGKLPAGLIMSNATTDPATIEVIGGSLALQDLRTVYTEAIPLNNLRTDGKITVGLMLLPTSLKAVNDSQNSVEVSYTIIPRPQISENEEN